ncbi:luciferase family protein [Truepera radiovictrix]|uniref:Luciferase domain-containing protein n=1 Tax=Truepera radiovictrix (strain DSM 17093 / CIP 108686 / LMG 22925 / RQ-24) TaxID=649638 RepID=D7CTT6_TRURR|nr:luciferase family protein [Truepera radiovictrix]ADI15633.1 conserved hypothetical protein [Truepera radiovictrix DSM 17093]WMT58738.1 DUF5519 family protein [Truepera radiovictrix]
MKSSERIDSAVSRWKGVTAHPHRFGGTAYRLGTRELGYHHGEHLVDIPFPKRVRDGLLASSVTGPARAPSGADRGAAQAHHVLTESGWVSIYLRRPEDVGRAVALLRRAYELATAQAERRAARGGETR